ncbi:YhfC family intramembrane metalloprotease [Bacillus sp. Marseille-P3661]|uniref:YhfC family intramembrane metalloprotease n=1 Tax=Bacillus sp. Marseille-P3661 TaxID=1936234 RepID=UPI000C833C6F|nr:YhfC family intramembrane metalloprotease [Bacillus sp. Marseille-P3661]
MVSQLQIAGMVLQIIICLAFPTALIIYLKRKHTFSWKSFFIGIVIFIVFSQILEKLLHLLVIDLSSPVPALKMTDSKIAFVLYGALAAGVFEELGRYFGFKVLLRKNRNYYDGLSFGIGHGGIEAILIGALTAINSLVIANLINNGMFDATIGASAPPEQVEQIKNQIMNSNFAMSIVAGLERVFAILLHIAFSLIVLLGVREHKFIYVVYAIGLHALLDIAPALYQVGILTNIWVIELIIAFFGISALYFIIKVKARFGV